MTATRTESHGAGIQFAPPKSLLPNFRCRTTGGSPRFGSSHLRLRPETLARTTFCYPDSYLEPDNFGVASAMSLIELAEADENDPLDDYIEAQVHGPVRLVGDVEALVLDPSFRGTSVERAARRLGCPVEWHGGFRLGPAELRRYPDFVVLSTFNWVLPWPRTGEIAEGLLALCLTLGFGSLEVCYRPDGLVRDGGDDVEVAIIAQDRKACLFGCCRNQQVDWTGRPVLPDLCHQLLHRLSPLEGALCHRDPAENGAQQPLLLKPVGKRASGIEKFELYYWADRDQARGQLLGPGLTQLILQDPEQARGVNEVDGGAHLR
jgi:hypothetical protein